MTAVVSVTTQRLSAGGEVMRRHLTWPRVGVGLLVLFFSAAYIALGLKNYAHFRVGVDLAHYGQALFYLSHGELPYSSFKGFVLWGDHAHFILVLLAPLWRLLPDPRLLIVVQALAVTTTGPAIYAVARDLFKNVWVALAAVWWGLAFIGIQYALNVDFHPSVLTGAALIWTLYAWHFKRLRVYGVMLILGLLTREDAGPIFFLLGFYQLLCRQWKIGVSTMVVSASYFLLVGYVVMPIWTPGGEPLLYLNEHNKNPFHIIFTFFRYPIVFLQDMFDTATKVETIKTLFASFAWLPLLSPFTYLTSASIFFSRFVNAPDYRWLLTNHSNANIWPILVFGTLYGIRNLQWLWQKLTRGRVARAHLGIAAVATGLLLVSSVLTGLREPNVPLRRALHHNSPATRHAAAERAAAFHAIERRLSPTAAVAVSSGFASHVSEREPVYLFPYGVERADVLIVSPLVNTWPLDPAETSQAIFALKDDPTWRVVWEEAKVYAFVRAIPLPRNE